MKRIGKQYDCVCGAILEIRFLFFKNWIKPKKENDLSDLFSALVKRYDEVEYDY